MVEEVKPSTSAGYLDNVKGAIFVSKHKCCLLKDVNFILFITLAEQVSPPFLCEPINFFVWDGSFLPQNVV